jgi:hypothetical protein
LSWAVATGRKLSLEAEPTTDPDAERGVRPYALDADDAARLWEVALERLAVPALTA